MNLPIACPQDPTLNVVGNDASFRSAPWLQGGHLHTLYATRFLPIEVPRYQRRVWISPSRLDVQVDVIDGRKDAPVLVLFHGLFGNSHAYYAKALAWKCLEIGWTFVVPHLRSGSGNPGHSIHDANLIDWLFRRIADKYPHSRINPVGVSFGSLAILRWLANNSGPASGIVSAAAVVSAPLDLPGAITNISSRRLCPYQWYFQRKLLGRSSACLQGVLRSDGAQGCVARFLQTHRDFREYLQTWHIEDRHKIRTPTLLLGARTPRSSIRDSFHSMTGTLTSK